MSDGNLVDLGNSVDLTNSDDNEGNFVDLTNSDDDDDKDRSKADNKRKGSNLPQSKFCKCCKKKLEKDYATSMLAMLLPLHASVLHPECPPPVREMTCHHHKFARNVKKSSAIKVTSKHAWNVI